MSDDVKRIDVAEFRSAGYLQEVNRQLLHPLGLALEVVVEEDGTERLGGIWDYRDDREGVVYGAGEIDPQKIYRVAVQRERLKRGREAILGGHSVQLAGDVPVTK